MPMGPPTETMTTNDGEPHPKPRKPHLRALTEDEMSNGLDPLDWLVLEVEAEALMVRKIAIAADDTLASVGRKNGELAERRLADGLPAYVKLDGVQGIVRQMPDGTRDEVEIVHGVMTVRRRLPPVDRTPW